MKKYADERREPARALFDELRARGMLLKEPTEDDLAYFGDAALYADVQSAQDLKWIQHASELCACVASGSASPEQRALFWVRVGGLFMDIRPHHVKSLMDAEELLGDLSSSPAHGLIRGLVDAISFVAAALSEDELFWLEYRRHVECHPRQNNYRARLKKDGSLKDVSFKTADERVPQAESEERLQRVLQAHGYDEERIAVHIATRIRQPLQDVLQAAKPLYSPRHWKSDEH